jgi:transcriptional regulator with XRE-family HTH domain
MTATVDKTIGERIRDRRELLGLSQEELAKMIGYTSRSSINKIETGVQQLRQSKIKAIADALDTNVNYILGIDSNSDKYKSYLDSYMERIKKIISEMDDAQIENALRLSQTYLQMYADQLNKINIDNYEIAENIVEKKEGE